MDLQSLENESKLSSTFFPRKALEKPHILNFSSDFSVINILFNSPSNTDYLSNYIILIYSYFIRNCVTYVTSSRKNSMLQFPNYRAKYNFEHLC